MSKMSRVRREDTVCTPSRPPPMPPSASPRRKSQESKTPSKPSSGGGDIRGFFGNASAKKATPVKKSGTTDTPILIDSSDDEEVKVKPPRTKATTSKHFPAASSSKRPISIDSSPEPPSKPTRSSPRKPASKRKVPDDEEDSRPAKKAVKEEKKPAKKVVPSSDEEEEEVEEKPPPKAKAVPKAKPPSKKEPKILLDSDSEEDEKPKPKSRAKPAASSKAADAKGKAKPKAEDDAEDEKPKPKSNFRQFLQNKAAGPRAPGSKDIPEGKPDCLAGLTMVFTGELESLGRDDAIELAKRYGAKVTGAPSKKTSYVVIGENAGPSKLKKIEDLGTPTLDEDGFLNLIRNRDEEPSEETLKKQQKEEEKIRKAAAEMEKQEREEEKLRKRKEAALANTGVATKKTVPASSQLWTTKYAPKNVKEICGNKGQVEKLGTWLANWQKNYKSGFRKPGKDGSGLYRAVLISGPPGIGKTTSAHIKALESGYSPLELNASDTRSKKLIENATNIDNTSLDGYFSGKGVMSTTVTGIDDLSSRTCLIMDEVDGMSAGDRGGVGALNALIKKTKIPIILICNDRNLPKMKPLWGTTANFAFRRPGPLEVRARILSILHKEKLKIPTNVVDELIKGVGSDIRQVLNMLSTYKLGKSEMDFDEGKQLLKLNEKNTIMTPFTIIDKLTGPYAFSRTNKDTLSDRMELYFHDFSFVPLFMQEHYLKTNPSVLTNLDGPEKDMKNLELISKAADWISDGDLVDKMIHGGEQHWSLLPFHAVTSTVAPAYNVYGMNRATPGGGWGGPSFPQWLGQNSKQGKLQRELTDIQIRMRLRVSGGRDEIRQQYMPLLAHKLVNPLISDGAEAIPGTIGTMDEYYLGKDDWDAFVELGVGDMAEDKVLKQIPSAVKSSFTREYNKRDHPIAFHRADAFAAKAAGKKIKDEAAPDNEEVFEEDEPVPEDQGEEKKEEDAENDYTKDKLIKAVKPKGAKAAGAAKAGGAKKAAAKKK